MQALHGAVQKPGARAVLLWQGRVIALEERLWLGVSQFHSQLREDLGFETELKELDYIFEPAALSEACYALAGFIHGEQRAYGLQGTDCLVSGCGPPRPHEAAHRLGAVNFLWLWRRPEPAGWATQAPASRPGCRHAVQGVTGCEVAYLVRLGFLEPGSLQMLTFGAHFDQNLHGLKLPSSLRIHFDLVEI